MPQGINELNVFNITYVCSLVKVGVQKGRQASVGEHIKNSQHGFGPLCLTIRCIILIVRPVNLRYFFSMPFVAQK